MVYNDGKWKRDYKAGRHPTDLLNPETTRTFMELTHKRYAEAVGSHFGKTIKFTFTDEPDELAFLPVIGNLFSCIAVSMKF